MASITPADAGTSVTMGVGETLTISLPENATTGYRWDVEHYDPALLDLEPAPASYDAEDVGAAGIARFRLTGRKKGQSDVALKYWRHWEGEASIIERFRFRAVVTG